jgi:hypothetical protein
MMAFGFWFLAILSLMAGDKIVDKVLKKHTKYTKKRN